FCPAWGRPSACGGLSGRPNGLSITYGGLSTVRVLRGRSSPLAAPLGTPPQQPCVPPRAAAILVRSGFVTRNPALSARRLPTRAVSISRGAVQGPVTSRLAPIAARALPSQKGSLCAGETGRR